MTLHTLLNVFVKSHKSTKRPCLYVLYISNMNLYFPTLDTQCYHHPQLTPQPKWLTLFGRLCLSGYSSLHYKSKWLINGPGTGDTSSSRSIYTPIASGFSLDAAALLCFSLPSIFSSSPQGLCSSLIHPEVEYCLRSRSAERLMDRLRGRWNTEREVQTPCEMGGRAR